MEKNCIVVNGEKCPNVNGEKSPNVTLTLIRHTHTRTHTDSDECSLVAFCKNETITILCKQDTYLTHKTDIDH